MSVVALVVKDVKGIDLINNASAPYKFPVGAAKWYMYNIYPGLKRMDDRGDFGFPIKPSGETVTEMSGILTDLGDSFAPAFHSFANDLRTANPADGDSRGGRLWSDFLFWDPNASATNHKTGPVDYLANGMETGAVRSTWTDSNAVWGSLNAGPYTANEPGHQLFDSGTLAIARGNTPFLVNATGEIFEDGVGADTFRYDDTFPDDTAKRDSTTSSTPRHRRVSMVRA